MKSWDPFRDLLTIQDRLNKLFESVLSGPAVSGMEMDELGVWRPVAEVIDGRDSVEMVCELAGLEREDVKISIDGSVLTVEGERVRPAEAEGWTFHRIERPFGKFLRRFELPDGLDEDRVEATMADGVLRVILPKLRAAGA